MHWGKAPAAGWKPRHLSRLPLTTGRRASSCREQDMLRSTGVPCSMLMPARRAHRRSGLQRHGADSRRGRSFCAAPLGNWSTSLCGNMGGRELRHHPRPMANRRLLSQVSAHVAWPVSVGKGKPTSAHTMPSSGGVQHACRHTISQPVHTRQMVRWAAGVQTVRAAAGGRSCRRSSSGRLRRIQYHQLQPDQRSSVGGT